MFQTLRVLTLIAELTLTMHGDVHPRHGEHKAPSRIESNISRDKE